MTEPIAVDVPAKPSFSRTTPIPAAAAPLVAALISTTAPGAAPKAEAPAPAPTSNPAPKAEIPAPIPTPAPTKTETPSSPKAEAPAPAAPKAEAPAKPAAPAPNAAPIPSVPTPTSPAATAATIAATVAAVAATTTTGVPPEPLAEAAVDAAPTNISNLLARFNKKQLTISVAVLSLFAGIGAVKVMFPAKGAAEPTAPVAAVGDDKVLSKGNTSPTATTPPSKTDPEPGGSHSSHELDFKLPPVQTGPLEPTLPPGLKSSSSALPPPVVLDPRQPPTPPKNAPAPPYIELTGASTPAPSEPTAPPSVPALPPSTNSGPLPVPSVAPGGGPIAPPLPGSGGGATPPAIPTVPSAPVAPTTPTTPSTSTPVAPPVIPSPVHTKPDAAAVPLPGSVVPLPGNLVPKVPDTESAPKPNGGGESGVTIPPAFPPSTDAAKSTPTALPKPPELDLSTPPGATPPAPPGDSKTPAFPTVPPNTDSKSSGALPIPQPSEPSIPAPSGFGPPSGTPVVQKNPQNNVPAPDFPPVGFGPEGTKPTGSTFEPAKPPFPSEKLQPGALPNLNPSAPTFNPSGAAIPTSIKPAGNTETRPAAPEFAPKTTFDVDIHTVMPKEDYKSISREFYNDDRFAAALSAYNQNRLIKIGDRVDVPPIHVLKRDFPQLIGGGTVQPASGSRSTAPSQPEWNNAAPRPVANGRSTFTIPNGNGMTLQQIARQTMGSEQRWRDIYDLNPQVSSNERLLPGTELKMPADARLQ